MTRKYALKTRAERQEATRQRIVDATVALHEELGPARTSISAIAERAGVERLTVYRHFATERDIVHACAARFEELHPFPDASAWAEIDDPLERLALGLSELYRYYASTERMTAAALRDAPSVPAMDEPMAHYWQRFRMMFDLLVAGFAALDTPNERLQLAIRLAIEFRTWQIMMREQGMDLAQAVDVQLQLVGCVANQG